MSMRFAKRAAAYILGRGESSIRIKPDAFKEVSEALTKDDIRRLIKDGKIYALQEKHNKSARSKMLKIARSEGRSRGTGRRRGSRKTRSGRPWEKKIRSQRRLLRELKAMKKLDTKTFNEYYRHTKGNQYANKATMLLHMREQGIQVSEEELKQINEKARKEYER